MTEWVEAVEQAELSQAWEAPAPQLPMDHAAIFTTTVPLLSVALVFGIALVRSLP